MKTPPPKHPAEFSPEVLDAILQALGEIPAPKRVHDPYAGRGVRLGALCDRLGLQFSGTDIERYDDTDERVTIGRAEDPATYPTGNFTIVTSPVYFGNRISSDYVNGPTPVTKPNGRRAYGISLGRALHPDNLARVCRPGHESEYYEGHGRAVKHWGDIVIVNVDSPLGEGWAGLLASHGYLVEAVRKVRTRRYRGPDNSDKRADHEIVIVATQS